MERTACKQTRRSLLGRLKNWDDQASWREFFETYWKLIYGAATKAGLNEGEAEDVVQETVLRVAKMMDNFEYDPSTCSFKGWLMRITHGKIVDQFRKRGPTYLKHQSTARETQRTETVERLPDPASTKFDSLWDVEWQKNLIDLALLRVKPRIKARTFQIFYLNVIRDQSAQEVAQTLDVSVSRVYMVKHRVSTLIKQELKRIGKQIDSGQFHTKSGSKTKGCSQPNT